MMHDSFEGQKHISVFETTLFIQQNTLSVFNIIIQSSQSTVSLIRYPFDLNEFHQKIRFHYPKCKISFPTLTNPSKRKQQQETINKNLRYLKRRALRDLLPFSRLKKSNADKIEKYLTTCFQHPIISISSILKDFTSVQRDEDVLLTSQHTSTTLTPTIHSIRKVFTVALAKTTTNNYNDDSPSTSSNNNSNREAGAPISSAKDSNQFDQTLNTSKTPTSKPVTIDDFNLLKVLGKGCMGKVLLVRSKRNGELYALKSIKKNWVIQQKEIIHTRAERDILALLRSQPFLVNLHHVFQTSSQLFLVLDYYAGGDIATQLSISSSFSEDRTRFYAAEIVHGLGILHKHGIVYRDLKPENILIGRDGHIVLTDFGLSKIFTPDDVSIEGVPSTQTFCGTAEYLAPEILLGEKYTFVVDFWSLGTLLFEMLAGTTPFWADTHMEMYKRVLEDNLEFLAGRFDPITCNFLTGLLEKEACERLGWGEDGIEDILLHPYFNSIDWNLVAERKMDPPYIPTIKNETDLSNFDDMFTNMPARISESSSIGVAEDEEEDPFKDFSFDPTMTLTVSANDNLVLPSSTPTAPFIATNNNQTPGRMMRKRHSAALSFAEEDDPSTAAAAGPPTIINNEEGNSRAIKKRQTEKMSQPNSFIDLIRSPTISAIQQEDEEETSSIYSRSSMTFSFAGGASNNRMNRSGGIGSSDISIIERPNCPIPGQSRGVRSHSNASTSANSMCSYLSE